MTSVRPAFRSSGSNMSCMRSSPLSTASWFCMTANSLPKATRPRSFGAHKWRRSTWVSTPMPERYLLKVDAIDAFYGDFQALFGVTLKVQAGQVIAVIGANGAGKSTLLKSIAGLMPPRGGEIVFDGESIGHLPAFTTVKRGIALVPEGRR